MMRLAIATALAAIALPAAAQTVTVTFDDEAAMSVYGYQLDDFHQERLDHWRGEIEAKSAEIGAQQARIAQDGAVWPEETLLLQQQRLAELQDRLVDLNVRANEEVDQLARTAKSGFRADARPFMRDFAKANGIGEILVDPIDDDGPSFLVLNPAYDISAPIGEMMKSGPGADVPNGPDRPPVIRYVHAKDVYYFSGNQAAREADLGERLRADENRLAGERRDLDMRLANLEQRRLIMSPEEQELAELKLEADSEDMTEAYRQSGERFVLLGKERLASFKTDIYIYLANNPDEVKADIVRFIDDDALDGTLLVAHPDLDITEMVTARMTLPE
ncbi:OmpH family outer membrane protein [Henriciella mobilis]|uniref:OmpH family outer membrane protein n=1 Tax=Henriciella mobilis TaxID=2305467 RepID=UPI000E6766EC|nr:OmpH family outer membrane protein [Henriciella mobilis]RIJ17384.1 OmpH family outer membrane protein [Henriciella mobilis]RIJ25627.1 OmpH family outer membrane protein [Henriciella mobilis]